MDSRRAQVCVHNEWDPLEEIIVGTAHRALIPTNDLSWNAVERDTLPAGPFPDRIIEETEQDIAAFVEVLTGQGIVVRRPEPFSSGGQCQTPHWSAEYGGLYCPRDVLLAVGDMIIEVPSPSRYRYFETFGYKRILIDYLRHGARWFAAPKPCLGDELYDIEDMTGHALREIEPVFDAANVLRIGRDLLYLVSDSGNELGCTWLQSIVGPTYRVHPCRNLYNSVHIDTTLCPLRPGLVLVNPTRVNEGNMPGPLRGWDVIRAPKMSVVPYSDRKPISSEWLGLNLLMLNPNLAIVDKHQIELIRLLEKHRIDVIPLLLRHGASLGGGYHCITLDVRRRGPLEDYST